MGASILVAVWANTEFENIKTAAIKQVKFFVKIARLLKLTTWVWALRIGLPEFITVEIKLLVKMVKLLLKEK
jgi:hypothetical protein